MSAEIKGKNLFENISEQIKTFAIFSAENPLGRKKLTEEEFLIKYRLWLKDKSLLSGDVEAALELIRNNGEKTLRVGNFVWTSVNDDSEKAYLIFNIPYEDAETLARNFGQERFFYAEVSDAISRLWFYESFNVCKTYKFIEKTDVVINVDDFFSKYGFKIRTDNSNFCDNIKPIVNDDEFVESMKPNRTFMSRSLHRRKSYLL